MELKSIKKLSQMGETQYLEKKEGIPSIPLVPFIWIDSFLSLAGSILYERENNRKPNDIDIIVRAQEKDGKFWIVLDPALRLKIDRILEKRFGNKSVEWIASTYGPNWRALPLYDLVLVPRKSQKVVEMNEPEFAEEFYKEENYEEFCDFGSGHFSKFVMEHPEFNIEEFREYVIVHNKADRDSGELEDIAAPEILRLAREFAQEKNIQIEKRHSREKCMECNQPPVYECLWAEGIGHAWFCKEHFKEWATTGDGKGEIISVKEVKDGIVAKKFGDNRNPNIWAELKAEFAKEFYKKLSNKQREECDRETAIINENKKKPQAEEVHEFKAAKYTHPNGHPRCLICGDEEPVGGVCNMPDSWYQKHEFDDEGAWKKEREILREKGIIKQGMDWVNSPTLAYLSVYGKLPDIPLRGRSNSPKRMWNDKEVDKEFKDEVLEELNSIPEIEIRATDIGHSAERVAFVVFRFKDKKNDSKAKDTVDDLNKLEGLYCKSDIGTERRPRICVAGKIKLGDKNWEEWWNGLAGKIKGVVKEEIKRIDASKIKDVNLDEIKKGLYLVPPHGKLIYENKKTAIVKSKNFDVEGKYFILVSDRKAYGYIECSKGKKIDLEEFKKRSGEHLISEGERREWWALKKTFYLYKIRTFIPFEKPKDIILERGVQTFIEEVQFEKLHLEQFRAEGIDDDLKNPAKRWRKLLADLRYLFNSGFPRLKEGEKWGEWDLTILLKYGAKIIDTLRNKCYFTLIPAKIGDEEYKSSYWKAYREAREKGYIKTKPPEEKEVKEWDEKRKKIIKDGQEIAKFTFKKIDEAEHIAGGVVYFSYKTDSQEDWTTPSEVWKALKRFMLKKKKIKVMHQGKEREIPIIENYFVEEGHHKGSMSPENLLVKGDWWLAVYLGDKENKDIWERVLKKELTGFSMAGRASSP